MSERKQKIILKIILIFILLQPFLDILSRLAILDVIPNISTYLKPVFVFGVMGYLLWFYSPNKKGWYIYILSFIIFMIGHSYILYMLLIENSVILHEIRFMINIAYMIALFIILYTLYYHTKDKEGMFKKIKNTLFYTFFIYFSLYLIAILTGTSGMTYEYADKYKLGYKGWYDSGQILGHAFSIMFPIILYGILKPKNHKILRVVFMVMALICVSLLGTKVPYFITLIVLFLYLIIVLFIKFFNREFERNWFNIFLVVCSIVGLLSTYKYTPVAYNTDINNKNALIELSNYDLNSISGKKKKNYDELKKKHKSSDIDYLKKYDSWGDEASDYLEELFYEGKVHPSNTRAKQLVYSHKKFMLADWQYKLFGIGFLNQDSTLSLERDFFMALYNFGILGFLLFLSIPIVEFIKSFNFIVKNLKKIDLETYMLFMGIGIFFCISIYAGYTYIYTNFSIFLVLLFMMLKLKIDVISSQNVKQVKSISFLTLHLGYGGIESATINSANSLVKDYDVSIVSFYRLSNNQVDNIDKNIKLKFLYEGEPNRDEFLQLRRDKKYILMFLEGLKSLKILFLKKFLIIRFIRKCKSDAIVSTRVEFNVLLSKYGKYGTLKIAQEHCYHNNNKKYINKIKNSYYRIDYLCALTRTLKADYEKFLEKNTHTKVILLPNMLVELPNKKSDVSKLNLITVSRLDYGKRVNEIIDMFSKVENKDSKLFIIGDGDEYSRLHQQIKNLNLTRRVKLLGYKSHKEIEKYMLNSSIFLMASVTEGLPMVLLEAMSYGVPCIAYKTDSGTEDIIEHKNNGFIINNRDEKEYITDINLLLKDNKLRKGFSKNAIIKSKEFYKDNILKIWKDIFDDYARK